MADVYRNSYLTVAATRADSADGGCITIVAPVGDVEVGPVRMRRMLAAPTPLSPETSTHFPLLSRA